MGASYLNQTEYTPVGDIVVIVLCYAVGMFLFINKTRKDKNYRMTMAMIVLSLLSSMSNITYRMMLVADVLIPAALYTTRILNHLLISSLELLYILYLREPLWLKKDQFRKFTALTGAIVFVPILADLLGIIFGFGFRIENNTVVSSFNPYMVSYIGYLAIVFYMLIRYRSRMIHKVFVIMIGLNILSLTLISMQGLFHQTSFASIANYLPISGIVYLFHSTPFDTDTGAVTEKYLYAEINTCAEKNTALLMISCYIQNCYELIKNDAAFRQEFFRFFRQTMRTGVLYRLSNDRMVLTIKKKKKNLDYNKLTAALIQSFDRSYRVIGLDYKLVVCETVPELKRAEEYVRLITFIEEGMEANTTHRITAEDIGKFHGDSYIMNQLEDIARCGNLNDERVLVFCQPVFNIVTGTYDTAEALMRLRLPEKGMVFPDRFIPIAEKTNMIHALTKIILNKTCAEIHSLISEGYIINRVSVNFSALDLRRKEFRSEVQDIIERNDIPFDKVAIEITESRSELEFNQMKQKIAELQSLGIKFYLDDFGTGYSNFERIMELPFDIIKFDRSMLIESVKNDSSKYMVSTFANMFNQLNYSVLFEGVEDDRDEKHCVGMHASYLQGYKYSKPIPIGDLRKFLVKESA